MRLRIRGPVKKKNFLAVVKIYCELPELICNQIYYQFLTKFVTKISERFEAFFEALIIHTKSLRELNRN